MGYIQKDLMKIVFELKKAIGRIEEKLKDLPTTKVESHYHYPDYTGKPQVNRLPICPKCGKIHHPDIGCGKGLSRR